MSLALWLTQSFLLSVAIFFLLGEEFVSDHKENLLRLKMIPAAGEKIDQYCSELRNSLSYQQCCEMNKSTALKWQIPFGALSVAQTSLFFLLYSLRTSNKPLPFLRVVCATCWALTSTFLLTKLAVHLSYSVPGTTVSSGYAVTLFTYVRNALTTVLLSASQRILRMFVSISKDSILLKEEFPEGLYFCSSELESLSTQQAGINISRAIVLLTVAYFISSCYTLCLLLAHEEHSEPVPKSGNKTSTGLQARTDKIRDRGEMGDGHSVKATNRKCASRNCLSDLNKKEMIVAFMEEESDEDSFVFGWRL